MGLKEIGFKNSLRNEFHYISFNFLKSILVFKSALQSLNARFRSTVRIFLKFIDCFNDVLLDFCKSHSITLTIAILFKDEPFELILDFDQIVNFLIYKHKAIIIFQEITIPTGICFSELCLNNLNISNSFFGCQIVNIFIEKNIN
jgi:hypothetical protein